MGTRKTYALFTISQDNKIDEIYDCGKYTGYLNFPDFTIHSVMSVKTLLCIASLF
jgi:hypothetical protein